MTDPATPDDPGNVGKPSPEDGAVESDVYTIEQRRVCDYLQQIAPDIGCGLDPVGFLVASHNAIRVQLSEARAQTEQLDKSWLEIADKRLAERRVQQLRAETAETEVARLTAERDRIQEGVATVMLTRARYGDLVVAEHRTVALQAENDRLRAGLSEIAEEEFHGPPGISIYTAAANELSRRQKLARALLSPDAPKGGVK